MKRDIELLKRAKTHMENLANGTDPFSGEVMSSDALLNDERLSRCFAFVAGILQEMIENDGAADTTGQTSQTPDEKTPFFITPQKRKEITLNAKPIDISSLTKHINKYVDTSQVKKLKGVAFGTWLMKNGFLEKDGNFRKPTARGSEIGIDLQTKELRFLTYSREAQQFLINNLDEIINISNRETQTP